MTDCRYTATIHNPARARLFRAALGTPTVPIVDPVPQDVLVDGLGLMPVLYLDLETLPADRRQALAREVATRWHQDPDVVRINIALRGFPIIAHHCTVTIQYDIPEPAPSGAP